MARKSNAARKPQPQIEAEPIELEMADLPEVVLDHEDVEVDEITEQPDVPVVEVVKPKIKGVNPIVTAGHDLDKLRETYKTKSGVIRFLAREGFETKHICVFLDIRYQHVNNVLTIKLKKPITPGAVETF